MQHAQRILIAVLAILALAAGATVASADRGGGHGGRAARSGCSRCSPIPRGNPEGIAFDQRSRSFFVGITTDGAIYRGTLGSDTVAPFIPGATGKAAIGLKVRRGKLYVAGGPTGAITVYDLATKAPVATFQTGDGRLPQRPRGDPPRRRLRHRLVPADAVARDRRAGARPARARRRRSTSARSRTRPASSTSTASSPRAAASSSSSTRNSGKLFRIELGDDGASIDEIDEIDGRHGARRRRHAARPRPPRGRAGRPRTAVVPEAAPRRARARGSSARRRATSSAARRRSTRRRGSTSSSTPTSPRAGRRSRWRGSRAALARHGHH